MNWRTIVGLALLAFGIVKLYPIVAGAKMSGDPLPAEIGCGVWIIIGIYLTAKGVNSKKDA